MSLKKKRTIMIKDPQLRKIRTNLRRLILSACKAEQARIHDEEGILMKEERVEKRNGTYNDEKYRRLNKELDDQYWAIEDPLRASIIECPVCFKSDKDMTYNPNRKVWYCTDCYEKLRKGNIKRGTPEEFP
jgi:ribosomal protein L37AE/L43A